jgi:hypothetical protein
LAAFLLDAFFIGFQASMRRRPDKCDGSCNHDRERSAALDRFEVLPRSSSGDTLAPQAADA